MNIHKQDFIYKQEGINKNKLLCIVLKNRYVLVNVTLK